MEGADGTAKGDGRTLAQTRNNAVLDTTWAILHHDGDDDDHPLSCLASANKGLFAAYSVLQMADRRRHDRYCMSTRRYCMRRGESLVPWSSPQVQKMRARSKSGKGTASGSGEQCKPGNPIEQRSIDGVSCCKSQFKLKVGLVLYLHRP